TPRSLHAACRPLLQGGDRLDLDEEAWLGQPLDHNQRAGWIGRPRENLIARLADQRAVGPVGDVRVGLDQVSRRRAVVREDAAGVAPGLARLLARVARPDKFAVDIQPELA